MSPTPEATPPRTPAPRTRTPAAAGVRALLAPLAWLYGLGARARARSWRRRARRLPRPVLSVGNLTFGGTGKTPFVIHACKALQSRGRRPAVLSRGYRAGHGRQNDEALVLAAQLPGVPHLSDPDRFRAGQSIAGEVDCFVLDDGFQHHPLARDADIVLVDATDPFGGGWCPPAGRLREPLAALERATLVLLTRADLVHPESLGATMRCVRARCPAPIATARFLPTCASEFAGVDLCVACGIGNPRAFVLTVESMGGRVARTRFFRDHHAYSAADAGALAGLGVPVVVTEKDAVKLAPLWEPYEVPLHVVRIECDIMDGAAEIDAVLDRL